MHGKGSLRVQELGVTYSYDHPFFGTDGGKNLKTIILASKPTKSFSKPDTLSCTFVIFRIFCCILNIELSFRY